MYCRLSRAHGLFPRSANASQQRVLLNSLRHSFNLTGGANKPSDKQAPETFHRDAEESDVDEELRRRKEFKAWKETIKKYHKAALESPEIKIMLASHRKKSNIVIDRSDATPLAAVQSLGHLLEEATLKGRDGEEAPATASEHQPSNIASSKAEF